MKLEVLAETTLISGALPHNVLQLTPLYIIWRRQRGFMCFCKRLTIVKLFYRENYKYDCFSRNWGDCKGENHYHDVCVILNKTTMDNYIKGKLSELKPVTKNKLYVACSRANNHLYLIAENEIKHHKNKALGTTRR